ncbi:MAG TPA: nuclear transport factor 2 family protein [Stellaceae bacterium]|jgi:carboxymethylenebutenolidase|nr:nuclear transport factor 2 family protein [Stellaceae bacterium]
MSNRRKLAEPFLTLAREEHTAQEFVHKNVDATMRTMTAAPHVICVPPAMGGRGWHEVRDYYARHFIGRTPEDIRLETLSRTVDSERVVDEMVISFRHDIEMPWILPGIAPTGRRVTIPLVAVVAFRDGKVESEHIYWDQASVLSQVGLLASSGLPVLAAEQAEALLDPAASLNALLASTG